MSQPTSQPKTRPRAQLSSDSMAGSDSDSATNPHSRPSKSRKTDFSANLHPLPSKPTLIPSSSSSSAASASASNSPAAAIPTTPTLISSLPRRDVTYWSKKKPPSFQKPCQIASFSYDAHRNLHHDDRSLAAYHQPFPSTPNGVIDLNRGLRDWVVRDESVNEHLDSLLFALMHKANQSYSSPNDPSHPAQSASSSNPILNQESDRDRSRANLITWRGMMTRLSTCLYENQQGFEMNVMMVGGTIYIEEHVNQASLEKKQKQMMDERQRKFTYYGYNFESWCTHPLDSSSPQPGVEDSWSGAPNTNVQWCSIVKTSLGDKRIILGGEVDCLKPKLKDSNPYSSGVNANRGDKSEGEMVELKTSMMIKSQRDEERFESKMLRFYTQSFLLGVPFVVVGFRDYQGRLQSMQEFKTLEMPRLVRGKPHEWDPLACLSLAESILDFLQTNLNPQRSNPISDSLSGHISSESAQSAETSETSVYRLSFKSPFSHLDLRKLTEDEVLHEVQGGSSSKGGIKRVGFLPVAYFDFATRTKRKSS